MAVAVAGNLLVYGELDRSAPVLQVARDVPAGALVTADDLRTVDVDVDATVRTVPAADLDLVVGQHAKVRLVAGSLVVTEALQAEPLVAPGAAVVAVRVPDGALPIGLRERSPVLLVLPADTGSDAAAPLGQVAGRVVGLPSAPDSVNGLLSLSVEVEAASAPLVAAASEVAVVLLDPGADPA
ncbi:MAG: SAF domain-containing protein [Ilumatobacteraceae bacterium]|nr:SAF domain-containing protein [Ilumatobacteraceae bacterium]